MRNNFRNLCLLMLWPFWLRHILVTLTKGAHSFRPEFLGPSHLGPRQTGRTHIWATGIWAAGIWATGTKRVARHLGQLQTYFGHKSGAWLERVPRVPGTHNLLWTSIKKPVLRGLYLIVAPLDWNILQGPWKGLGENSIFLLICNL